jgi:hypothetical protein
VKNKISNIDRKVSTDVVDKPKKIRLLDDIFKELDSRETICHPKKNISPCRTSNLHVEKWIKESENIIPTIEVEGEMKALDNHEDDDKSSIPNKGKGKIDENNEDSDSSSSWNEEKLSFATHSELFPRDPLRFGEGASKFFEDETSSPQFNIGECMEEYSFEDLYISPPKNIQVSTYNL